MKAIPLLRKVGVMQITFLGVTLTISGGRIAWQMLPNVKELDDEPEYPMGFRVEKLERGKLKVYRYTQFPDRDMKFGFLLEIPEATYSMGGKPGAFL